MADEPIAPPMFVKTWGQDGSKDGQFEFTIGIAIHDQTIFVSDQYNNRVQTFDFAKANISRRWKFCRIPAESQPIATALCTSRTFRLAV